MRASWVQVQAELEAARQLAAGAAAERAMLGARNREVAAREALAAGREEELRGWRERAEADMARRAKVCVVWCSGWGWVVVVVGGCNEQSFWALAKPDLVC
jgi:hypothetical protein